jgi:hypothetical protein
LGVLSRSEPEKDLRFEKYEIIDLKKWFAYRPPLPNPQRRRFPSLSEVTRAVKELFVESLIKKQIINTGV